MNGSKLVPPTTGAFALIWTSRAATRGLFRRTPTVASHYLDVNFHHCCSGALMNVTGGATMPAAGRAAAVRPLSHQRPTPKWRPWGSRAVAPVGHEFNSEQQARGTNYRDLSHYRNEKKFVATVALCGLHPSFSLPYCLARWLSPSSRWRPRQRLLPPPRWNGTRSRPALSHSPDLQRDSRDLGHLDGHRIPQPIT